MNWTKIIGIGLLACLLGGFPALAADEETTVEDAVKKALSGDADPRKLAVQAFEPAIAGLDALMAKSKDRPEKVAASWEQVLAEHLQRWKALVNTAESLGVKRALPGDWKEFRKTHEAFMQELRTSGREALVWRHQTRVLDEGLKYSAETFPVRREVWFKLMNTVETTLAMGEELLKAREPSIKKIDTALVEVGVAGVLAGNVAYDAEAVRTQAKASLGKAPQMPTPVMQAMQRFAAVEENYRDVPEGWRGPVRTWADGLKQMQAAHVTAQALFDRTYSEVVQQQIFRSTPHFSGKQYSEFTSVVGDLALKLRVLKHRAEEREEAKKLLEQDRILNAKECKEYQEYMEATDAEKEREAALRHARGCGADKCRDKRLESARGPCSATNVREIDLKLARASYDRLMALDFQQESLKLKGNTAEDRARIERHIKELEKPGSEEQELLKFLEKCENNTNPEQQKLDQAAGNLCESKGPECQKFNDEWDEYQKKVDKEIKEQRKRDRKREERRRKIGLKPDREWRDCP